MFLFTVTMFFSGGMIPTYLVVSKLHLIDTFWAMVIPSAMGVWNVILTKTYIQSSIPLEIYESASIDAAPTGNILRAWCCRFLNRLLRLWFFCMQWANGMISSQACFI